MEGTRGNAISFRMVFRRVGFRWFFRTSGRFLEISFGESARKLEIFALNEAIRITEFPFEFCSFDLACLQSSIVSDRTNWMSYVDVYTKTDESDNIRIDVMLIKYF